MDNMCIFVVDTCA